MLAAGNDSAMLRFTLGKLYFDQSEMRKAVEHLRAAVLQDSTYSAAWKLLGRSLLEMQQYDEAGKVLQQGIAVAGEKGDKQAVKEMQVFLRRLEKSAKQEGK